MAAGNPPPLRETLAAVMAERGFSVGELSRRLASRYRQQSRLSWERTIWRILDADHPQETVNKPTARALARVLDVPPETFVRRRQAPIEALKARYEAELADAQQRIADLERRLQEEAPQPDPE